jgi:putative Ca2+/H+ antiporter (TMEM165/GDT1 family)
MDMNLTPLIASLTLFAVMEFGDKTHIAVITMATRNRAIDVFVGALAAFAIVDGVSVLFGGFIADLFPPFWINVASGSLFLAFGIMNLAKYGSPMLVFLGIVLASAVLTGSGILIGQALLRFIPRRTLRYIASGLFLIFGVIFLVSAFFGITIL